MAKTRHLWRSSFKAHPTQVFRRSDFSHLINGEIRRAIKKINLAQFVIFLMGSDNRLVAFVNYETDAKIRFLIDDVGKVQGKLFIGFDRYLAEVDHIARVVVIKSGSQRVG